MRTFECLVLIVDAARLAVIVLIHVSTWLRRTRAKGISLNVQVRTASSTASSVPRSQTCRGDQSA